MAAWASEHPELRSSCLRLGVCEWVPPRRWRYLHRDSLLQKGPTCGIVALCMLLEQRLSVQELLSHAVLSGYTNNGEMFSAEYMSGLCEHALRTIGSDPARVRHCRDTLASVQYVDALMDGAALLVPYDSDRNHSPCLNDGRTAHWALVTGVIVEDDYSEDFDDFRSVHVTAKHGKSLNVAVWTLRDLSDSNRNLTQVSPKRLQDGLSYVVPEGGLDGRDGLNGQFVLVEP